MKPVEIRSEKTSLATTRRFHLNCEISSREVEYKKEMPNISSPLAQKILGFPWADAVLIGKTYVAISKEDWVEWEDLEGPLIELIGTHLSHANESEIEENPVQELKSSVTGHSSDPVTQAIERLLEVEVNPAVAAHGGFISLVEVVEDQALIRMEGGCQGCGSARATLKEGVERAILEAVPEIKEVVDVTDHALGENPFYASQNRESF